MKHQDIEKLARHYIVEKSDKPATPGYRPFYSFDFDFQLNPEVEGAPPSEVERRRSVGSGVS